MIIPSCSGNRSIYINDFQKLKSDYTYQSKIALINLHKSGKAAIPFLIKKIGEDEELMIILVNPLSSTIDDDALKIYSGLLAAYVIELILGREKLDTKNFFDDAQLLGPSLNNYIYYYGRIVSKKGEILKKDSLARLRKVYENWWENNQYKPINVSFWHIPTRPNTRAVVCSRRSAILQPRNDTLKIRPSP